MSTKKQLKENILNYNPKPSSYFIIKNITVICILVILSIVSMTSIATFLRDVTVLNRTYNLIQELPWYVVIHGLSELLAIGFILILISYIVYRQTDWPLVCHQKLLLTILFLIVTVGGGVTAFSRNFEDSLDNNRVFVAGLPHRKTRRSVIEKRLRKSGIIIGKVRSIDTANQTIVIRTFREDVTLEYIDLPASVSSGDYVRGRATDKTIDKIKKIPVVNTRK